jgi:PilZ domain
MSSGNPSESNNASAVSSPEERRRNVRFPFSATVEAVEIKSGVKILGRTSDLGRGGCYVDSLSPFPIDAEVRLRIIRENESFEVQAKVVYSLIGMGMGLAFVSAQPKDIRVFQRWLLEASGKPVPPQSEPSQAPPEPAQTEKTQTFHSAVLSDLILTLMQRKVLPEREGKDLLRKLFS